MVTLRMVMRVISVVSQLILVRLLSQEDFGLVASAGAVYAMADMLSEFSLTMALVQMHTPERHHYDTAFTLVVLRGMLIGAVLWVIAPFVGDFMRDARVAEIIRVLAIIPIVQGFESVGIITLQRDLRFKRMFFYRLVGKLLGFVIAIPIAFIFRNYWALVLGGLVARLVTVPISYIISPYRPGISMRGFRDLSNFSKWFFISNLLTMLDNSFMTMTLGRFGGVRDVGLYQVSNDLAALPASEVAAPIRAPMYAGYARVASNVDVLREQVLTGLGFLLMIIVPMSAGIAVTANDVAHVVLGEKWLSAGPVMALCAAYTLFDAIGHFTGSIYVARNAQRPYVTIMAVCLVLRLALVIPAAYYGGLLLAVGMMALTAIINAGLWFSRMRPLIEASWGQIAQVTWRSFAATLVMSAAVLLLQLAWPLPGDLPGMTAHWVVLCLIGAIVHIASQSALWWLSGMPQGPEAQLLRRAHREFGSVRGRLIGRLG